MQTGIFITLAWPDTFVSTSGGPLERFLQLLGAGKNDKFRGGHAALALIERATGLIEFHDFGRYITPDGFARTRGTKTDPEVAIDLRAKFDENGQLTNLKDILIRLEADPEATHGDGRMLASFCYETDYKKAKKYINDLMQRGSIVYSVFGEGSNCSRFVADSFKAGTLNTRLKWQHQLCMTITPSPIGNVVNGSSDGEMWEVYQGIVRPYKGGRLRTAKELIINTFGADKEMENISLVGNMAEPPKPGSVLSEAQWLGGRGAGSWFHIMQNTQFQNDEYRVLRYVPDGSVNYDRIFRLGRGALDLHQPYQFIYDCHAAKTTIIQNDRRLELQAVRAFERTTTNPIYSSKLTLS